MNLRRFDPPEPPKAPGMGASAEERNAYREAIRHHAAAVSVLALERGRTQMHLDTRPMLLAWADTCGKDFEPSVDADGRIRWHRMKGNPIIALVPSFDGAITQDGAVLVLAPGATGTVTWGGSKILNRVALIEEVSLEYVSLEAGGVVTDYSPISSPTPLRVLQMALSNEAPQILPASSTLATGQGRIVRGAIAANRASGDEGLPLAKIDATTGFTVTIINVSKTYTVRFTVDASVN